MTTPKNAACIEACPLCGGTKMRPTWDCGLCGSPASPDEAARRVDDPCTCAGCWACAGHVPGCTCDVDWDEVFGDGR